MEYYTSKHITPPRAYTPYKFRHNIIKLKKLIFPPISDNKINQLMIDDESIKYITFTNSAHEITNVIMNNLDNFPCPESICEKQWNTIPLDKRMKQLVITEMTAGVGGNVLNFANHFKYVNAIEIDTLRCNYLSNNIKLYDHINVNCYNDDSIKLLIENDDLRQDIIFFDPPWGGKDYKLHNNLRLYFSNYSIENICKILFQRERNKMIVLKLPNNYDFVYLEEELKEYQVSKFNLDRMTIVIIKNYSTNTKE